MSDLVKNILLWVVIAVVLMSVFQNIGKQSSTSQTLSYSQFLDRVEEGQIDRVVIDNTGREITGQLDSGETFRVYSLEADNQALIGDLRKNRVEIQIKEPEGQSLLGQIFISWFPFLLLIGVWIYFMRQMQGGGGRGAMSFGKSKAKLMGEDQVKVTFADVAGVDEAKEEVQELVDFLRDPGKFQRLGGSIPRGVLMVGSPGTGKTLLAKAIAGEAKVPFFTISGSDFVEMFVGVGASRVRDMFDQAKKHAPCIIFIDEIDAVGRHRGAGLGGGHDEREQTLNQLLVEMDGFEGNEGVIVIAATNRPDVLDPALLRPGRFDRRVVVPLPDIRGREHILKVHMRKVPLADNVKPMIIARGTPGFSGADLANLVNEAALFAARANKRVVDMEDFERAKDKILMGAERKSMVMSEDEKRMTAYHEAGHTIVARMVPGYDPVYKVSIIPRGRALGITMILPESDPISRSVEWCNSAISVAFGGRIAEEVIFGKDKVSTGAQNDIKGATSLARDMVMKWGFSQKLGPILYSEDEDEVFLGRAVTQHKNVSDETAYGIDTEVRRIIEDNYQRAEKILKDNIEKLHMMANALIKYETIDSGQVTAIMEGREPGPPADWGEDKSATGGSSSGTRKKPTEDPGEGSIGGPASLH